MTANRIDAFMGDWNVQATGEARNTIDFFYEEIAFFHEHSKDHSLAAYLEAVQQEIIPNTLNLDIEELKSFVSSRMLQHVMLEYGEAPHPDE